MGSPAERGPHVADDRQKFASQGLESTDEDIFGAIPPLGHAGAPLFGEWMKLPQSDENTPPGSIHSSHTDDPHATPWMTVDNSACQEGPSYGALSSEGGSDAVDALHHLNSGYGMMLPVSNPLHYPIYTFGSPSTVCPMDVGPGPQHLPWMSGTTPGYKDVPNGTITREYSDATCPSSHPDAPLDAPNETCFTNETNRLTLVNQGGQAPQGRVSPPIQTVGPATSRREGSRSIPRKVEPPSSSQPRPTPWTAAAERAERDNFLVQCRASGMKYRDVKRLGNLPEAESTLRGRYRSLTKGKSDWGRRCKWTDRDVSVSL